MSREEMLIKLGEIEFAFVWGDWEDVGFTERQIWVNGKGYGYLYCDEPNSYFKLAKPDDVIWKTIISRIEDNSLTYEDIENTVLGQLFFCDGEEDFSIELFDRILDVKDNADKYFYCAYTCDKPHFYNSLQDMIESEQRDYCSVEWEELSDEELMLWVGRFESGELEMQLDLEIID